MKKALIILIGLMSGYAVANPLEGKSIIGDEYWQSAKVPDLSQYNIDDLTAKSIEKTIKEGEDSRISPHRQRALKNAALSFASQAGLAKASMFLNEVNDRYNKDKKLDKTYDFDFVKLETGFYPPVITMGRNAGNQPNTNEFRAADFVYKIEMPAQIRSRPPVWEEYLMLDVVEPELPPKSSVPSNRAEQALWDEYVKKGWEEGYQQAAEMHDVGLARLKRDYDGMLLFKKLYAQNMVTKPVLAKVELGVTGGGNEMAIGDRVIKKTYDAELNPNAKQWFKEARERAEKVKKKTVKK